MEYPLYDVPYLVRDPNEYRMSKKRHQLEVRNQAVVDDYFLSRAKGASAHEAREVVAERNTKMNIVLSLHRLSVERRCF